MRRLLVLLTTLSAAMAAEMPVSKVILYKHGVGYFERAGELGPGESARLDFKASEMNDVLKSLTLAASGGDKIAALRYDASEPVASRLARFPIRLADQQPLSSLLDQLKGETVELQYGNETVRGAILGARLQPGAGQLREQEQVTLLLDSGEIATRDLTAASALRFPDPALQLQFRDYLAVLSGARSQERRSVYIDSTDSGRRQIRASYMIPTPVWKSSYRLIFGPSGQPTLEGWAIVDNTTGDDWTKVEMALVSGRPISFISPLYEPKHVSRITMDLPDEEAQQPVLHQGVVMAAPSPAEARAKVGGRAMAMMEAEAMPPPAPMRMMDLAGAQPSAIAAAAEGREAGELFEYRFSQPVTVRQDESAMLPFLQQTISARKLLIYSDGNSQHPTNAAELTNDTNKTLDGGPITVFDAGTYAGEALMETTKAGDKRLISYGVDLGTRITTAFDSEQTEISEVHLRRGMLTAISAVRETKTFTMRNVDQKEKTLIIEHPARPGYRLMDRQPTEKTANAYRFEAALAAGQSSTFVVREERQLERTFAVVSQTPDFLATIVRNQEISQQARQQLSRILDKKREIAAADTEIGRLEERLKELASDQERLRQNMESLNRVSGQQARVQEYAGQLAEREAALATMRDDLDARRKQRDARHAELNQLIETAEF